MPAEQLDPLSPRLQSVVEELQGLIRRVDPTATFQVVPGDDPTGTYVIATVDVEDTETVIDVYIDRLFSNSNFGLVRGLRLPIAPSMAKVITP